MSALRCIGACALAPAISINGKDFFGHPCSEKSEKYLHISYNPLREKFPKKK